MGEALPSEIQYGATRVEIYRYVKMPLVQFNDKIDISFLIDFNANMYVHFP